MTVTTRFAPSPTGVLHLGSLRTALFCWLYARHHRGQYLLRIEDTDRQRSTPDNVQAIFDGLEWLGLDSDRDPVFQTDRIDRYRQVVGDLLEAGKAYHCYCTREELAELRERQMTAGEKTRYDGRCRDRTKPRQNVDPVIRFRNPDTGPVVVEDLVRGRVVFRNEELDDLVIVRSDGTPTYNFSVIVDDHDMSITHVIRGDDHLNNTPRQMNLLAALGADVPAYAHLPMILGPDGAKLSKRHGGVDIRNYRDQGYLPAAMLNFLVRLGWSHGDQEVFSIEEMIDLFDIVDVNQSAAMFNPDKLRWLNQQHIIAAPAEQLGRDLLPFLEQLGLDPGAGPAPESVAEAFRERAETLQQMAISARWCYEDIGDIDVKVARKYLKPVVLESLTAARQALAQIDNWTAQAISAAISDTATRFDMGFGKLGQPLRVATTGGSVSPPIDVTLELIGRERTLARIDRAIGHLESKAPVRD